MLITPNNIGLQCSARFQPAGRACDIGFTTCGYLTLARVAGHWRDSGNTTILPLFADTGNDQPRVAPRQGCLGSILGTGRAPWIQPGRRGVSKRGIFQPSLSGPAHDDAGQNTEPTVPNPRPQVPGPKAWVRQPRSAPRAGFVHGQGHLRPLFAALPLPRERRAAAAAGAAGVESRPMLSVLVDGEPPMSAALPHKAGMSYNSRVSSAGKLICSCSDKAAALVRNPAEFNVCWRPYGLSATLPSESASCRSYPPPCRR